MVHWGVLPFAVVEGNEGVTGTQTRRTRNVQMPLRHNGKDHAKVANSRCTGKDMADFLVDDPDRAYDQDCTQMSCRNVCYFGNYMHPLVEGEPTIVPGLAIIFTISRL